MYNWFLGEEAKRMFENLEKRYLKKINEWKTGTSIAALKNVKKEFEKYNFWQGMKILLCSFIN